MHLVVNNTHVRKTEEKQRLTDAFSIGIKPFSNVFTEKSVRVRENNVNTDDTKQLNCLPM